MTDKRPAVFLDRDGTINIDAGYIDRLERFELYPFAIDAIRLLHAGRLSRRDAHEPGRSRARDCTARTWSPSSPSHLADRGARRGGGRIDGHYYCPHSPDAAVPAYRTDCDCRKPKPGMALRAAATSDIDLARSVVIGDRWRDIAVASAVGCRGILVKTGYGATEALKPQPGLSADASATT